MWVRIFLSFNFFCHFYFSENLSKNLFIKRVDVAFSLPYVEMSNDRVMVKNRSVSDSFSIFYNSNFILYKLPYTYSEQHNDSIILSERRFTYFIYKYGNSVGFNFNPTKVDSSTKLNVDSFLAIRAFANIDLYSRNSYNLYAAIQIKDSFNLTEKYISTNLDRSFPDTLIYYYSDQIRDLHFSFTKKLEEIKKLKIIKIRGIFKSRFDEEYKTILPYRELYFELKPQPLMQDSVVHSIFNLFAKESM